MTTKLARAKVDRVTQVKNELAFRKGDIIEVLNKTPGTSGMWQGRVYSNAGSTKKVCKDSDKGALFPSSYVVPLSSDETNRIVGANGSKTTTTTSSTSSVTHGSFLSKSAHKPSTPTNHSTTRPLTLSPSSSSSSSATTLTKSSSNPFHKRSITSLVGSSDSNSSGSNVSNSSPSRVSHVRSLSSSRATMSVVTTSTSSLSSSSTSSTLKPARATLSSVEIKKRGTIIIDTESPFCIDNELKWKEIVPITVEITVGETKAKFSGLKKFTTYTIKVVSSKAGSKHCAPVERRYKHFVWLHQRLCEEFPLLLLPSLPEKQIAGRFDDQVVEYRRRHLEIYLNYCTHHPIIGASQVLMFFIENPGEVTEWKAGKRAAEKEAKETGDLFLQRVKVASESSLKRAPTAIEGFKRYSAAHQKALLAVCEAENALNEKVASLSPEYGKVAERISQLCDEKCWDDGCKMCGSMHKRYASYAECCKAEMDALKMDSRISFIADISQHYGLLIGSFSHLEKRVEAAEASAPKKDANDQKVDKLRAVTVAEMKTFHEKQGADLYQAILSTAEQELEYHKKMVERWEAYVRENSADA